MRIDDIKINGITNPIGFNLDHIKLSWKVRDSISEGAANIKITVSISADFSDYIWEKSGADLNSIGQEIDICTEAYTRYYCRIIVTGDKGDSAEGEAFFERGKGADPWTGQFISTAAGDLYHPIFEKTFACKNAVTKARLYVSGLGLYEAYVNGTKAGDELLTPFCNDYRANIQYQTYDVTDSIVSGSENSVGIICGNGWYKGRLGFDGQSQNFGSRFAAVAELHIWYADGSKEVIATDKTWTYRGNDIETSDLYDGEIFNRQLWEGKANPDKLVELITHDTGTTQGKMELTTAHLVERISLPLVIKERLNVKEVIHTPAGETVLDMGQNMVGFIEFASELPAGTKVTFDFGEVLQQDNFYNGNYRSAKARFEYISDGRKENVRAHFTFYGFRYVRVTGWPGEVKASDFTGCVIYSDLDMSSYFNSSSDKLNRLAQNCMWGQKSNFLDMPTDCPQRDERLGWTGDAQVFAPTACYNMDTRAFYHKFLSDLRIEQLRLDGAIPNYIPNLGGHAGSASVWGDVATFLPMTLYRHYGDKDELRQFYPMMKDWVDWIIRGDEANGCTNLWNFGFHFGDWLAQDGITPQSMKGGTDDTLTASLYYYESVSKAAEAAEILGNNEDAQRYRAKAEKIKTAIFDEFFTANGRLAADTQTSYLMCLNFGIYRDKDKLLSGLKERIRKDCYKIKGGFIGATMMCQVLAQNGMEDIASYILFQEAFPGWMHCINLGATTIWERWNSVLDDGSISGTGMNSLNHYSYGSVMEYVYRYMAGIKEEQPGFKKVQFAPQLNNKLKFIEYSYDSVSGRYSSAWKINDDGTVTVRLHVPFGCSATVLLPDAADDKYRSAIELVPGEHEFTYKTNRDYRKAYTMDSRLEEMQEDPRVIKILEQELPIAAGLIRSRDAENLNLSLKELQYMFFMGFNPEMVQKAAEVIMKLNVL